MRGQKRSSLAWYAALASVALLAIFLGGWAFWYEPSSLRVVRHKLFLARADAAPLSGLRIAVLSDIHAGAPYIDNDKLEKIVRQTNRERPDLILLTGDYVVNGVFGGARVPIDQVSPYLKQLHARLGVFAVIGNHDRWNGAMRVTDALQKAGITVLENRWVLVRDRGEAIYLAGIGDAATPAARPKLALSGIPQGQTTLCFTHSPDVFPALPDGCTLVVAGHTHGGQINLPLFERLIVPSRFGRRYAAGLIREGDKTMFVSTGIGTSMIPARFRVPPEITILDIHANDRR
jgi:uncharacterized protein